MRPNQPIDFWSNVDTSAGTNGCWPWMKSRKGPGYGTAYFKGFWIAHRLAFFLSHNFLPEAVCHHCDNPPCCNPNHLYAGTRKINNKDRDNKGRHKSLKGASSSSAKLTEENVKEIRSLNKRWEHGGWTQKKLAKRFNVHFTTIGDILRRKTWTNI